MPSRASPNREREHTGHIRRDGFGHVDVQSGIDDVAHLVGEEIRNVLERNGFDAALDQPLVAGQAGEPPRRIDAKRGALLVGDLWKVVRDGVHVVAAMLSEQPGNPPTAAAQADDAELYLSGQHWRRRLLVL